MLWDPPRVAFTLPWVNLAVTWYGILFAIGFFVGYRVIISQLKARFQAKTVQIVDRLAFYVFLGTVIGSRIGHLFFYENLQEFIEDPLEIFRMEGLASHGAVVGIMMAAYLFYRSVKKELEVSSFLTILDWLILPVCTAAVFIRFGNFMNQEILGTSTELPWGVIFGHPVDGLSGMARHPAQLYEAFFYLLLLMVLWKRRSFFAEAGQLAGVFLMTSFGFRFLIEGVKVEQSALLLQSNFPLTMGQILSIPLIILGVLFFFWRKLSPQKKQELDDLHQKEQEATDPKTVL